MRVADGGKALIPLLEILGNAIVGGMESYVLSLARRLPRDRFKMLCLCPFESRLTDDLRKAEVDVYISPLSEDVQWETLQLAMTIIRVHGVKLLHAHLPNAHLLAGLLSSITGVPAVATIHGRSIPMRELEISSARVYSRHRSLSERLHACAWSGHTRRESSLDPQRRGLRPLRKFRKHALSSRCPGIPATHQLIGFVGRLSPEKAPDMFVRMASLLHGPFPDKHFVMVGEGPLLSELRALVDDLRLAHRIHFAGLQSDMPAVYHSLELLVSSSTTGRNAVRVDGGNGGGTGDGGDASRRGT